MRLVITLLFALALQGWTLCVLAEPDAARVALVRGKATATATDSTRVLKRHDLVGVGETVRTGPKGLVQLVFPDRSMLYVKADSELRVDAFHFNPEQPEQDASVSTLLKGGLRAISGLVAKRSPDDVEYNTRVSTIGIRGTAIEIAQGGAECLAEDANPGSCGGDQADWAVTFDFGEGWVETEAGRIDLAQGETARFTRQSRPDLTRFQRSPGDPAFVIRQLAEMDAARLRTWSQEQAARMRKEDLLLTVGMLGQDQRFTVDRFGQVLGGFSRDMTREEREELREFSSRLFPARGERILRSTTDSREELVSALESMLRGLENAPEADVQRVYEVAVEMGITTEQAEQVLENIKENPLMCR